MLCRLAIRNFWETGSNPWKRAHQNLENEDAAREYYRFSEDQLFLLPILNKEGRKGGAGGEAPRKFSESHLLHLGEHPLCYRGQYKKTLMFISWKGRGLDTHDPPSCAPVMKMLSIWAISFLGCNLLLYPGAFSTTTGPLHWQSLVTARYIMLH